jgi:hypothetical protein
VLLRRFSKHRPRRYFTRTYQILWQTIKAKWCRVYISGDLRKQLTPEYDLHRLAFLSQYFNFFVRRKRVKLIMNPNFEPSLRAIFQETLFGPEEIDLADEFAEDYEGIPDLKV